MQNKTADEMSDIIVDMLINKFEDKVQDFEIFNIVETPYKAFSIRFTAYNYFIVLFNYDRGLIGCSIQYGENNFIGLKNSQEWYEKADFDIFCKELQEQLELRIPDKFLEANGWK